MMKLFLILALFIIRISSQTKGCDKFFNPDTKILFINDGEECQIASSDTFKDTVIHAIVIEGFLIIEDDISLHLKFSHLSFGLRGFLLIGQQGQIIQNKIIFEDISLDQDCLVSGQILGNMKINSSPFYKYKFSKQINKGEFIIYLDRIAEYMIGEKLTFVGLYQQDQYFTTKVSDAIHNQIFLSESFQENYLDLESPLHHPSKDNFAFLRTKRSFGVEMKRICLTSNKVEVQGVAFTEPKGLHFNQGSMKQNLFEYLNGYYSGEEQIIRNKYYFNTEFTENILYEGENIELEIGSEHQYFNNTFIKINIDRFNPTWIKSHNIFKECHLNIQEGDLNSYFLEIQSSLFQSKISLSILEKINLLIQNDSFIFELDTTLLNKFIKSIEISNSLIMKTNFSEQVMSQIVTLNIVNSIIDGMSFLESFIYLVPHNTKDLIEINLKNSTFQGFYSYVIQQLSIKININPIIEMAQTPLDLVYEIRVNSITYNTQTNKPLFYLFKYSLVEVDSNLNDRYIVQILQQNYNQLLKAGPTYLGTEQNFHYNSKYPFAIFKITLNSNPQNSFLKSSVNGKISELIQNSSIQIFNSIPMIIQLESYYHKIEGEFSNIIASFFIELFSPIIQNTVKDNMNTIVFYSERTIKKIEIFQISYFPNCIELTKQNEQLHDSCEILQIESIVSTQTIKKQLPAFSFNEHQNSVTIEWKSIRNHKQLYFIHIDYCNEGEQTVFQGGDTRKCKSNCPKEYNSKYECSQTCQEEKVNGKNIEYFQCYNCKIGCKICSQPFSDICIQCSDGFYLSNSICLSECPRNTKRSEKKCLDCLEINCS